MLSALQTGKKVVGIKQLRKALKDHAAKTVFLARNADPKLLASLEDLCAEENIPCVWAETMQELGSACGIDVGAAAAATLIEAQP